MMSDLTVRKRNSAKGLYYEIIDEDGQRLATSRIFHSEVWYKIGSKLFFEMASLRLWDEGGEQWDMSDGGHLQIDSKGENDYAITFKTDSGKPLLTTRSFETVEKAFFAVHKLRLLAREGGVRMFAGNSATVGARARRSVRRPRVSA